MSLVPKNSQKIWRIDFRKLPLLYKFALYKEQFVVRKMPWTFVDKTPQQLRVLGDSTTICVLRISILVVYQLNKQAWDYSRNLFQIPIKKAGQNAWICFRTTQCLVFCLFPSSTKNSCPQNEMRWHVVFDAVKLKQTSQPNDNVLDIFR